VLPACLYNRPPLLARSSTCSNIVFFDIWLNNLLKSALLPSDQQGSFKLLGRMVEAAQASDKV
jgi:hypothetical protein